MAALRFPSSPLTLSLAVVAGMAVVGLGLAQLTIPTSLSNATIYIKDILLTSDGTSATTPRIALNGAAGTVMIKSLLNIPVLGTDANGAIITQTPQAVYNYISSQIQTAISGAIASGANNPITNSGANGRYYNPKGETPTETGVTDIYFADPAIAGPNAVVRIGMQDPANNGSAANYIPSDLDGSQLIVKGDIESRTALKLRAPMGGGDKSKVPIYHLELFKAAIRQGNTSYNDDALIIEASSRSGAVMTSNILLNSANPVIKTKVGINTPSTLLPDASLDVYGDVDVQTALTANGQTTVALDAKVGDISTNASAASISHTRVNNSYDAALNLGTVSSSFVATQRVKIAASGDSYINGGYLGIGLLDPQMALHVNGDVRANAYYYNSDRRLKTDISVLDNALDAIRSLRGYRFIWKESKQASIGLIAQEVEKIFPDLVTTDVNGIKSVQYGNLVAPLIEAVRTLADRVDSLVSQYLDQQEQIDTLSDRVAQLEAAVAKLSH